jgi:hypothetical protein
MFGGLADTGVIASAIAALRTIGDAANDASKVRREIRDIRFSPVTAMGRVLEPNVLMNIVGVLYARAYILDQVITP